MLNTKIGFTSTFVLLLKGAQWVNFCMGFNRISIETFRDPIEGSNTLGPPRVSTNVITAVLVL